MYSISAFYVCRFIDLQTFTLTGMRTQTPCSTACPTPVNAPTSVSNARKNDFQPILLPQFRKLSLLFSFFSLFVLFHAAACLPPAVREKREKPKHTQALGSAALTQIITVLF
jgi:hypothetical protein